MDVGNGEVKSDKESKHAKVEDEEQNTPREG